MVNAAQDFRLGDRSARPKLRTPRWHLTHLWRDRLDANRLDATAAKCQQRRRHSRYQCEEAGAEEDLRRRKPSDSRYPPNTGAAMPPSLPMPSAQPRPLVRMRAG